VQSPLQTSAVADKPALRAAYITPNVHVDAQCDKLATELSWQRFASKVAVWVLSRFSATEN